MKLLNFFLVILIIFTFNILKADEIKIQNKITKNLRCLICQGQSVYDSDSEFAISLKLVVKNKMEEGFTEDQIYKFLTKSMVNGFCMTLNSIKTHISYGFCLY